MTPSERERRIEAATNVLYGHRVYSAGVSCAALAREALDAADEAVPVVSEAQVIANVCCEGLIEGLWQERAERAEAAARDLASLAQHIVNNAPAKSGDPWTWVGATMDALSEALACHPSLSGL